MGDLVGDGLCWGMGGYLSLVQQKYQQIGMSKCHFPQDNYTIILDFPSIQQHNTLRLIETEHQIPLPSILSLSNLDKPTQQPTRPLLLDEDEDLDSLGLAIQNQDSSAEDAAQRKRKGGCTCKKTNCIKMYCQCFAVGRMCGPECGCSGCYNHSQHQGIIEKAKLKSQGSNRHTQRGCNCRKTNCQKKYCECYNAGLACTELCNCTDCCNHEEGGEDPHKQES